MRYRNFSSKDKKRWRRVIACASSALLALLVAVPLSAKTPPWLQPRKPQKIQLRTKTPVLPSRPSAPSEQPSPDMSPDPSAGPLEQEKIHIPQDEDWLKIIPPELLDVPEAKDCQKISTPGEYEVKPCDKFIGPLGVNFRVNEIDHHDQVQGNYIDTFGNVLGKKGFGPESPKSGALVYAYYGLKLYSMGKGVMILTDNPQEICSPYASSPCSAFLPNDALEGDVLVSENGYFGKTNDPQYAQLATCAANNLAHAAVHTSQFLGLPQPEKGLSQMFIFLDQKPKDAGLSHGPVSIWFYQKGDPQINYEMSECEKWIQSGNFAKGDHEITHAIIRNLGIPFMFNEGLGNYVPRVLKDKKPQGWETKGEIWNHLESACKENGFKKGSSTTHPYTKYYNATPDSDDMYVSGECFWQKLVFDYGQEILPKVFGVIKKNVGKNKSFEDSLIKAGVDTSKYQPWGLGKYFLSPTWDGR